MVDEAQLSTDEQVQEIVLEGADEEQVLPADDSESENSSNVDLSVQSDSTSEEVLLPHEENPVDALGAVEDLVGGV